MKRLLLPLIAAIALPSAAEVKIPRKVHNECKDVADYKGCVELRLGKTNKYPKGTRKNVSNGTTTLFHPDAVVAKEVRGEYGRYMNFRYFVISSNGASREWSVDVDCEDYTANWDNDNQGWIKLRGARDGIEKGVKEFCDEFCPKMNRLVREAKSGNTKYFRYPRPTATRSANRPFIYNAPPTTYQQPRGGVINAPSPGPVPYPFGYRN